MKNVKERSKGEEVKGKALISVYREHTGDGGWGDIKEITDETFPELINDNDPLIPGAQ